jgi:hypothetical protein
MKYFQLSIINGIFWLFAIPLQAQKTATNDSSMNREMTLEKEYSPTIESAVKISRVPELREPQAPKSEVAFSNYSTAYEAQPTLTSLTPQAMFADLNASKYAGYASFRLSSVLNFDGDAAYQILHTDCDFLNVYFSHRSSNSKNPSLQAASQSQKFFMNDNWGGANFTHRFDNLKLSAGLKYARSAFNYSGLTVANRTEILLSSMYPPEPPVYEIRDYPNQVNNMLEVHAGIFSDVPNKLHYQANVKYTDFKQKDLTKIIAGMRENRLIIDWDLHDNYNETSKYGLSGFFRTFLYKGDTTSFSVFSLTPYYYMEGDNLNLTLGLRADFEAGGRKKHTVAPHIRFNYKLSSELAFYASALGGRNDNSNYNLFYENRYLYPSARIRDARTFFDGTVGGGYLPISNLSVDVFAGYRLTADEHFFTPFFTEMGCLMQGHYGTAHVVKLGVRANYTMQDVFGVDLKGTFYSWHVEKIEAYHKPRFEAETDAFFRAPNIPLRVNMIFRGLFGRKTDVLFSDNTPLRMKNAYDLSVKASYSITPFLSATLSANNLLFQKYDIWYGYPAQKFNIMGGISIVF